MNMLDFTKRLRVRHPLRCTTRISNSDGGPKRGWKLDAVELAAEDCSGTLTISAPNNGSPVVGGAESDALLDSLAGTKDCRFDARCA